MMTTSSEKEGASAPSTLRIDFETRATVDLVARGIDIYADDPNTDAWCMGWAFNDEPVQMWRMGEPLPSQVREHVEAGGLVGAWNAAFELGIWNRVMVERHGWPRLRPEQCRCTMVMAAAMSLPLSLDKCAKALSLDITKDMPGHRLMMRVSKPRTTEPLIWWDDEDRLRRLEEYCAQDVEVERRIARKLLPLSATEQELWVLDQTINQRGVPVDLASVEWLIDWCKQERKRLNKQMFKVTGGQVRDCSDVAGLARYAGVQSVAKAALEEHLKSATGKIAAALQLRQEFAKTSTKKLEAFRRGTMPDGRMRGIFQFYGAESTGRWAGRRVQPQNMPRPTCGQDEIERRLRERDFRSLRDVSDCLRAMIAAPQLVCADFSAIEARVLAWLSGQEDVLDVFREGGDLYKHAASGIYSVTYGDVDKDQRQIGKVAVLALGYQGAVGAFNAMAQSYGVVLPKPKIERIVKGWRDANPKTVQWWADLENGAERAIRKRGKRIVAGGIPFRHAKGHLWLKLPSGRMLCFPRAKIGSVEKPWGTADGIKYVGENSYTRKVEWLTTYGGKIAENITQAVARDLLAAAMVRVEAAGHEVVMHVHDELVAVKDGADLKEFEQLMAEAPEWAAGLPLAAEGWIGERYRK